MLKVYYAGLLERADNAEISLTMPETSYNMYSLCPGMGLEGEVLEPQDAQEDRDESEARNREPDNVEVILLVIS
ncbi:unnamed protein product [Gongylonema pulchrum]|uniref:Uncharacterized protein n=1 Tax=Gongylonema pulchrum TaxID=637853 RepID=A0A183ETD5_9BILA|nr:unnamed protein product [Gongylonema pulchrum]